MATPDELRTAIAEGRAAFRSAIEAAAAVWEKKPATGEGEAAWSARETAEHTIPSEPFFATSVCDACGYPGVTWEGGASFPTAAAALIAFDAAVELSNKRLKHVSETDLPKKKEGDNTRTCQEWMEINAWHLNDHAAQVRAAAGG